MDPSGIVLLIVLLILIVLSGFFSATEMAFTSVNQVRLKTLAADGNKRAKNVLKLLEKYDRLLSTILVGNNIVNITAASLATVFFTKIMLSNPDLAVTLSTVVTTVVVLIFGEITPKSIVKEMPERFTMAFYPVIKFFTIILLPINAIFVLWKKLLNKMFKIKPSAGISEDELITYVEVAKSGGGIDEHESRLIKSAIEFEDLDIDDIMIPRVNVAAVEENANFEDVAKLFRENGYSRLPVYTGSIDSIIGIIHEKDFYNIYLSKEKGIKGIISPSICVAPNMKISTVLRMLQKGKVHMAIVVDEFGGTAGIVTLEDILEELVGEIWDEHDKVEVMYKKLDESTYLVRGSENIEELLEAFEIDYKEEFDSISIGGFITEQLEKIPVVGEKIIFKNLEFSVTKANTKCVLEVKVKVLPIETQEE